MARSVGRGWCDAFTMRFDPVSAHPSKRMRERGKIVRPDMERARFQLQKRARKAPAGGDASIRRTPGVELYVSSVSLSTPILVQSFPGRSKFSGASVPIGAECAVT